MFKNVDFDSEYPREWLKEFDRPIKSDGFEGMFADLLRDVQ